jgi:hypothetical protein
MEHTMKTHEMAIEAAAKALWTQYEDTDCDDWDDLTEARKAYARQLASLAVDTYNRVTSGQGA